MRYTVYADESYVRAARYRSICSFSFPHRYHENIETELSKLLDESEVSEFKWKKLNSARMRFCAEKMVAYLIHNLEELELRMDVLIWDTYDNRHNVLSRDDRANFERMFFHLLKSTLKKRDRNSEWKIFPDERLEIDWSTIQECLECVGAKREEIESPLFGDFFSDPHYSITHFEQIVSDECPCCQMADLFAGLSVYSIIKYDRYEKWVSCGAGNMPLFEEEQRIKPSNAERERFEVIKFLNQSCKNKQLGVSLKSNRCLFTFNPNNPINFWHYVPQHDFDKAPTRDDA